MIYKFKSQATGELIMMAPEAEQVLQLIGHAPAVTGIIAVAAMPAAIQAIEQATGAATAPNVTDADDEEPGNAVVTLRQRAWPLLDMMRRAHAEGADIVWGV